jgi:iron complex transport system ATP-binding protein
VSDARTLLDRITTTVSYLRVTVDPSGGEWVPCDALVSDPDALSTLVRTTMAGRGTDRLDVATSLLVQGYAFRFAAIAIGGWLLADAVIDLSPADASIALGRHRPNAVGLRDPDLRPDADALTALAAVHDTLVEQHLARLVDTAHRSCRIGEALLWGNVAAACASSFGAFANELGDRRAEIRGRADTFFATARPAIRDAGRLVAVGDRFAWERSSCCLWYRTDAGSRCEDCSLWTPAEREATYALALVEGVDR